MKTGSARWWILAWIFVADLALGLQASFEPVANNTIYEDNPTYASGLSSYLFVGPIASGSPRRVLLRFDVTSLPANAQITSVNLSLTIDRAARSSSATDVISLHRLPATWGEGTSNAGAGGSGTQASAGDSTWNARFYHSPPGVPSVLWNQPGGDFWATASASQPLGTSIGKITVVSSSALVSDVQDWVDNANANHGWIVLAAESLEYRARRFYGRTAFSAADRPILTVTYELIVTGDHAIPTLSGWAMMLLVLGVIGIARTRI